MTYAREIPRDLFNEANLLKCLGRLALIALDRGRPESLRVTHRPGPFDIRQSEADGSIYCANVQIVIRERLWEHRRPLNSREPWPLWIVPAFGHPDDAEGWQEEIEAFDDDGNLNPLIVALIDGAQQ